MKKKVLLIVLTPILLLLLYLLGVIIYGTLTDFQPDEVTQVQNTNSNNSIITDSTFTFMIWNIGYGGLGADADFFYDGGSMVRSPQDKVNEYLKGIIETLRNADSIDFILLQEVDVMATRSWEIDEAKLIAQNLIYHNHSFAPNYKVHFVPLPIINPMGKVYGGLLNLYFYTSSKSTRQGFVKENFDWPKKVFFLDRCMLEDRFNLPNGKQLIVYNTHKSAYDVTGKLKQAELERMKVLISEERTKGNYVVVGGDWNQMPPNFNLSNSNFRYDKDQPSSIDPTFLSKEWNWVYDAIYPTNRSLAQAYNPSFTTTSLIDYYLISNNLELIDVKNINLDFAYSDHQPVYMKVKLK